MEELMRPIALPPLLFALSCVVAGCASGRGLEPEPLPAVPERVETEADASLAADARDVVIDAADAEDPQRRTNAAEAAEGRARPILAALLRDEDPIVRFAAAMAVGRSRVAGGDVAAALAEMLRGQSPNGRVAAVFALHRLGERQFSQYLVDASRAEDAVVRGHAALALGLTGEPSAAEVLRPMLIDKDATVRLMAAEALWRLGDEAGRKALLEWSVSAFVDDNVIATLALGAHRDPSVIAVLQGKLTDDYEEVRLAAARALGRIGSDAGYGVALRLAGAEDARQRGMAALALGDIGRLDAQPVLARLLREDPSADVRLHAAAALLQLYHQAAPYDPPPTANPGR